MEREIKEQEEIRRGRKLEGERGQKIEIKKRDERKKATKKGRK